MIALIDADSLVYIIAWNYKDAGTEDEVKAACDNFLKDILTITGSTHYIGSFSAPSDKTFRKERYRYAEYKGNRGEKSEWMVRLEPVIKSHYITEHSFIQEDALEADDIISGVISHYRASSYSFQESWVICSPDKDLRQIPGKHYNYKATKTDTPNQIEIVNDDTAFFNFWMQMLTGDSTDNVAGVPGLGEVKARKLMDEWLDTQERVMIPILVRKQYIKYFGEYYGIIIYEETLDTLRLLHKSHRYYEGYKDRIENIAKTPVLYRPKRLGLFDLTS